MAFFDWLSRFRENSIFGTRAKPAEHARKDALRFSRSYEVLSVTRNRPLSTGNAKFAKSRFLERPRKSPQGRSLVPAVLTTLAGSRRRCIGDNRELCNKKRQTKRYSKFILDPHSSLLLIFSRIFALVTFPKHRRERLEARRVNGGFSHL